MSLRAIAVLRSLLRIALSSLPVRPPLPVRPALPSLPARPALPPLPSLPVLLLLGLGPAACQDAPEPPEAEEPAEEAADDQDATDVADAGDATEAADDDGPPRESGFVEIRAHEYGYEAPDAIPSGWVTYRLVNEEAHEIHELSIARLPEERTYQEYREGFMRPWEEALVGLQKGELSGSREALEAVAAQTPGWTDEISYVRARGLVSPGRSTTSTVYLEPGEYVLECWLRAPDGTLHLSAGMTRPLTVAPASSGAAPPTSDYELTLTADGIETPAPLRAGDHAVAVRFEGPDPYDNVHLVRLEEGTDLVEVARWLDWYEPEGLEAPAPADFLGGVHVYGAAAAGDTAYFGVEGVEPGRYAWVVEAPPEEEAWLPFTVE